MMCALRTVQVAGINTAAILLAVVLNVSCPLSVSAQHPPARISVEGAVRRVTLEECVAIALREQPAIQVRAAAMGSAVQRQRIARSYFFPQVNYELRYTHLDDPVTIDFPSPLSGPLGDVFTDAASFFSLARLGGSAFANAALNNPNLPPFSTAKQAALSQLPDTFRVGLLGENSITNEIQLLQPLWTGGKIRYRHRQAGIGVQVAHADVVKSRQQTEFNVTRAYLSVQLANEMAEVLKHFVDKLEILEEVLVELEKEENEYISKLDLSRTQTVRLLMEGRRISARQSAKRALAALKQVMGIGNAARIAIADARLPSHERRVSFPAILDLALKRRPELTKAVLGGQFADLERRLAKANYMPDVGLFGRFSTIHDDANFANPNRQQEVQWAAGVSVGIPLFTGGRRSAQRREAEFQQAKARQTNKLLRGLITLEVQDAYLKYEEARKRVSVAKKAAAAAAATVEEYRRRFRVDVEDKDMPEYFKDRTAARILEIRAKTVYNQSLYDFNLMLAKLKLVSGSNEHESLPASLRTGVVHISADPATPRARPKD